MVLHGSAIALGDRAALIRGPSGSGKSDLVLRCLTYSVRHGGALLTADLVADDQVIAERRGAAIWLSAPSTIRDRIEVRGLGIRPWRGISGAWLAAVVDLVAPGEVERMPEPETAVVAGQAVPRFRLAPFEASSPAKLLLLLADLSDGRHAGQDRS